MIFLEAERERARERRGRLIRFSIFVSRRLRHAVRIALRENSRRAQISGTRYGRGECKAWIPDNARYLSGQGVLITDSHGAAINNHRENKRELIGNGRAIAIEKKAAARLLSARSRANTRARALAHAHCGHYIQRRLFRLYCAR